MQKLRLIQDLKMAFRKRMPYGMIQDTDGRVVLFNRDYEALTIGDQKEFHFNPWDADVMYEYVAPGKFLLTEDGSVYVGTMFFLYDDANSPVHSLSHPLLIHYLWRLMKIARLIVGRRSNAFAANTYTQEQMHEANKKLKMIK